MMIRKCTAEDFEEIYKIINDAASAYRGVIAADCWHEPYMPRSELREEISCGVLFWGFYEAAGLAGVMGLQEVRDVALIRHAYTRIERQKHGIGRALLTHVCNQTDRPVLVGTWKAATWAVRFYERSGFRLVRGDQKEELLRRYWSVPDRQIDESVVLADQRWFSTPAPHVPDDGGAQ